VSLSTDVSLTAMFESAEEAAKFLASGELNEILRRYPTVQADTLIALDKTKAAIATTDAAIAKAAQEWQSAVDAWKLVATRLGELVEDVRKGIG